LKQENTESLSDHRRGTCRVRSNPCCSISALTAGIFGARLSVKAETIVKLKEKFGYEEVESFIRKFNTAGRIEALTEKQAQRIFGSSSLESLRNRILEEAREAGISPSTWEVRRPAQVDPNQNSDQSLKAASDEAAFSLGDIFTRKASTNPHGTKDLRPVAPSRGRGLKQKNPRPDHGQGFVAPLRRGVHQIMVKINHFQS